MGHLSMHWTFWERIRWMFFAEVPDRDMVQHQLRHLRREWLETNLKLIEMNADQAARLEKISFLESENVGRESFEVNVQEVK